jgi:signal transduction histidine kinase
MIISLFEMAGLLCSLVTLLLVARSAGGSLGMMKSALLALVALLAFEHLANILESRGLVWADTVADHFSTLVPFIWGLFLLESGRVYLSARLRASDEQVRFFLEAVPAAVAWLDEDTKLVGFSQAWQSAFPRTSGGARLEDVVPVPLPELASAARKCLAGESQGVLALTDESGGTEGERRYFRWSLRPWLHPDRAALGVLVLLQEVTTEHEAETKRLAAAEELAATQRMAHVGQMAAGAAHDFNNFLQVIHAAMFDLEGDTRHAEAITNVQRALESARELTRAMLRFGREPSDITVAVDLVSLIEEMQRPLSYALGRRHRLEVRVPHGDEITIEGRANRIQQALLNLAINARDAMPSGGAIQVALAVEKDEAVLSVRDSGTGIPASVRAKLFTPFFTTKGAHGSGLGLNVVKTVVEEHHGQIAVESEPEQGTTFSLRLPLFKPPARAKAPESWS